MTLKAKTALYLLAGGVAGFLGWCVIDLTGWFSFWLNNKVPVTPIQMMPLGALYGFMIGFMIALIDAMSVDSLQQRLKVVGIGAVSGLVGGAAGLYVGQLFYTPFAPAMTGEPINPGAWVIDLVGRALGWCFIGLFVGASQGLPRLSLLLVKQGAFGGAVGGFVGGIAFYSIAKIVNSPIFGRLVGFVILGAAIGFLIGLVQDMFKQAWIRVMIGRNEGKEYLIVKPVTTIGRSELADIGLFGDGAIAPYHCAIERLAGRYLVRNIAEPGRETAAPAPLLINGMSALPGQDVVLQDGDSLEIARRTLQFRERSLFGRRFAGAVVGPDAARRSPSLTAAIAPFTRPPSPAQDVSERSLRLQPGTGSYATEAMAPQEFGVEKSNASRHLVCLNGPYSGKTFQLGVNRQTIGRSEDCDISLQLESSVSRNHAHIDFDGNSHRIQDDDSTNGTWHNGNRVTSGTPHRLKPLDTIRLGNTVLRYD